MMEENSEMVKIEMPRIDNDVGTLNHLKMPFQTETINGYETINETSSTSSEEVKKNINGEFDVDSNFCEIADLTLVKRETIEVETEDILNREIIEVETEDIVRMKGAVLFMIQNKKYNQEKMEFLLRILLKMEGNSNCNEPFVEQFEFIKGEQTHGEESEQFIKKEPTDIEDSKLSNNFEGLSEHDASPFDLVKCEQMCSEETEYGPSYSYDVPKNRPTETMCTNCGMILPSMRQLIKHKKDFHSKERNKYKCEYCTKVFFKQAFFMAHINREHNEFYIPREKPEMKCAKCSKIFDRIGKFERHEKSCKTKNTVCNICGRFVKSDVALRQHKSKVHGKTLINDNDCTKTFHKPGLYLHDKQASEDFATDYNERKEIDQSTFVEVCKNENIEDEQLPFPSENYDQQVNPNFYKLTPEKQMISTIKSQSKETYQEKDEDNNQSLVPLLGEKYFTCEKCDKQFTGESGLYLHNKSVHEGVRYSCNQCDYKATQKSKLKRHVNSIHEGVHHPCNQCDYKTTRKDRLRDHLLKFHSEQLKIDY